MCTAIAAPAINSTQWSGNESGLPTQFQSSEFDKLSLAAPTRRQPEAIKDAHAALVALVECLHALAQECGGKGTEMVNGILMTPKGSGAIRSEASRLFIEAGPGFGKVNGADYPHLHQVILRLRVLFTRGTQSSSMATFAREIAEEVGYMFDSE